MGQNLKTSPIYRKIKLIKGAIGGKEVKKVTVLFSLRFNGSTYKNVEFALDDRSGKTTPVLINRKTMKDMNVIVNPSRAFSFVDKPV